MSRAKWKAIESCWRCGTLTTVVDGRCRRCNLDLSEEVRHRKRMQTDEPMNQQQVIDLMITSRSEEEWNANADKVKAACGGRYPAFWFFAIVTSGVMAATRRSWEEANR